MKTVEEGVFEEGVVIMHRQWGILSQIAEIGVFVLAGLVLTAGVLVLR